MLVFRSEEHVNRWRELQCLTTGEVFTTVQLWRLAKAWYTDRLDPNWRRRTPEEAEQVFSEIGLSGDFWRLRTDAA